MQHSTSLITLLILVGKVSELTSLLCLCVLSTARYPLLLVGPTGTGKTAYTQVSAVPTAQAILGP
jgi:midasin (ATPase involved in ribosome maturation)